MGTGPHSRQVKIVGQLLVDDPQEMTNYQERKLKSASKSYFLFQAQNLNLSTLSDGDVLIGHIVESKIGEYEPKNKIIRSAVFQVQKVLLNISNPFFIEEVKYINNQLQQTLRQDISYSEDLLSTLEVEKKHCCDKGKKPCNWKC